MSRPLKAFLLGTLAGILLSGIVALVLLSPTPDNSNRISIGITSTKIPNDETQDYTKKLGKINVNVADQIELEALTGIGAAKASAIINFREKYGSFENITELLYVPGISSDLLNSLSDKITIR